jgi:hypothetical protein
MFFGYTPRWIAIRDQPAAPDAIPEVARLSPVRRQLLGQVGPGLDGQAAGDHLWGHHPSSTPLYVFLSERGLLDPANPPLRR